MMDEAKFQELVKLTNLLDQASRVYYSRHGADTGLSDTEFDLKLKQLQALEKELNYVLPYSPTQRVGSDLQTEFKKIKHPFPMLTIENTYNSEELVEWLYKMYEKHDNHRLNYDISVKYDGISCELHYKDGVLISGSTRGDKNVGDDITENVKTIKSIPLKLEENLYAGGNVYVRGEILMPRSSLVKLNKKLEREGKKTFANCRNACAGSVKQLDPKVTASRGLIFRPWDYYSDCLEVSTQNEKHDILKALGFTYEPGTEPWGARNCMPENVSKYVDLFYEKLKAMDLDYDWDGIVIKIDSVDLQKEIGTKDNRSIEWGIARKWNEDKEVITRLKSVSFQVGRTGNITPVGVLEPVACDGVTISNVILNNEQYIKDLSIQIEKPIRIVRSGSVIPKAIGTATEEEYCEFTYGKDSQRGIPAYIYKDVKFPETCPACGCKLEKVGEIWKCPNNLGCPAQRGGLMLQWVSKQCMDIEGIGPSVIEDLASHMIAGHPLELYMMIKVMTPEMVVYNLGEGYGLKSVKTMFKNIQASMTKPFETILFGMGIPGVGKENAKAIARELGSLENIMHASIEQLTAIEGIGPVLANNIKNWMEECGDEWLTDLKELGMSTEYKSGVGEAQNEQILEGMNLVFTGKSAHWEGDEVEAVLSSYGAKCGHGVSKKTTYLITGDKPGGSKVSKAKEIGVEVISEEDFIKKFNIPTDSLISNIPNSQSGETVNNIEEESTEEALF